MFNSIYIYALAALSISALCFSPSSLIIAHNKPNPSRVYEDEGWGGWRTTTMMMMMMDTVCGSSLHQPSSSSTKSFGRARGIENPSRVTPPPSPEAAQLNALIFQNPPKMNANIPQGGDSLAPRHSNPIVLRSK